MAQAAALVARYGFGCARHIVDYAHTATAETKYRPQTFGGILQYAARAANDYGDVHRREQAAVRLGAVTKAKRDFEALTGELAEKQRAQAEARLRSLSQGEYQGLYAKARAELLTSRWLNESSPVFRQVLHRKMIACLIREIGE